jgi:hypothetical protein
LAAPLPALARGRNHFGDERFRLVAALNPFGAATSPLGAESKFIDCQLKHLGYGFVDSQGGKGKA